ncbi:MAG: glutamate ABC transporter substrate-binding protein [Galactobacter sp.]
MGSTSRDRRFFPALVLSAALSLAATGCVAGPKRAPAPAASSEAEVGRESTGAPGPEADQGLDSASATPGSTGLDGAATSPGRPKLSYPVASDVNVPGSETFNRIRSSGSITIGVKDDQPGLGYLNATTGEWSGFDIEMARWLAASLGVPPERITFRPLDAAQREQAIANGDVDLYVGTYTITDERRKMVGFAGPYFTTGQGLLVSKDSDVTRVENLKGKTVCAAMGSTTLMNLQDKYPDIKTEGLDSYAACVEALKAGSVDAVSTDEAMLLGYATVKAEVKVVGEPFTEERYGIGLSKQDTALCQTLTSTLNDGGATWTQIYQETLGGSGVQRKQPKTEPCR